ncbi:hypothetical protein HPB50_029315 [Hyalomma asiaticum]|nr:hypothetical protein HPB50_029315 [Hyalomma asiaticum]
MLRGHCRRTRGLCCLDHGLEFLPPHLMLAADGLHRSFQGVDIMASHIHELLLLNAARARRDSRALTASSPSISRPGGHSPTQDELSSTTEFPPLSSLTTSLATNPATTTPLQPRLLLAPGLRVRHHRWAPTRLIPSNGHTTFSDRLLVRARTALNDSITCLHPKTSALKNSQSGNSPQLVEYEDELDKIRYLDDSLEPEVVRNSTGVASQKTSSQPSPTSSQSESTDNRSSLSGSCEQKDDDHQKKKKAKERALVACTI